MRNLKAFLRFLAAIGLLTGAPLVGWAGSPVISPAGGSADLSNLNANNLTSGTVPDPRFPAVLPAVSGVNLTHLPTGPVLQVVVASATVSDGGFYTTYTDTPCSGTITLKSATSLVRITATLIIQGSTGKVNYMTVNRDGSDIFGSDGLAQGFCSIGWRGPFTGLAWDAPGDTSPHVYRIQFKGEASDSVSISGPAKLFLEEIAQ